MDREDIQIKIQAIRNDLDQLRNRHIHELEKMPGVPKCETLANRIEERFEYVIDSYEEMIEVQAEAADKEQFNLLNGLLAGFIKEIADLTKKQPDGLVNAFKVGKINDVLKPLKKIMADEPSAVFLDLVAEVEEGKEKSRNSNSDVAFILSQYSEACKKYSAKYYSNIWHK